MSVAPKEILPWVGSSNPAIMRNVVVLPHPEGPSNAKNEPSGIVNDKSFTAVKSPYVLVMCESFKSPRAELATSDT